MLKQQVNFVDVEPCIFAELAVADDAVEHAIQYDQHTDRQELLAEIERLKELAASTPDDVPSEEEVLNRIKDVYSLLSDPDVSYDVKGAAVRSIISDIVVDQTKKEIHFHYYA